MNNENCLANILNAIVVLQNAASNTSCNDSSCTRPFLGELPNNLCFNTRPITFYRCDNSLVTLPYTSSEGTSEETTIFRVNSVTGNSIRVLLLQSNTDGTYTNTNTYATINLGCICAIRCLADTTINNV